MLLYTSPSSVSLRSVWVLVIIIILIIIMRRRRKMLIMHNTCKIAHYYFILLLLLHIFVWLCNKIIKQSDFPAVIIATPFQYNLIHLIVPFFVCLTFFCWWAHMVIASISIKIHKQRKYQKGLPSPTSRSKKYTVPLLLQRLKWTVLFLYGMEK